MSTTAILSLLTCERLHLAPQYPFVKSTFDDTRILTRFSECREVANLKAWFRVIAQSYNGDILLRHWFCFTNALDYKTLNSLLRLCRCSRSAKDELLRRWYWRRSSYHRRRPRRRWGSARCTSLSSRRAPRSGPTAVRPREQSPPATRLNHPGSSAAVGLLPVLSDLW